MAKVAAIQHVCTECGTASGRWLGRCPGCGEFGTMVAEAPVPRGKRDAARAPLPGPSGSVAGAGARVRIGNAGKPVG